MSIEKINLILKKDFFDYCSKEEYLISKHIYESLFELCEEYYGFVREHNKYRYSLKERQDRLSKLLDFVPKELIVLKKHINLCIFCNDKKIDNDEEYDENFRKVINDFFKIDFFLKIYDKYLED